MNPTCNLQESARVMREFTMQINESLQNVTKSICKTQTSLVSIYLVNLAAYSVSMTKVLKLYNSFMRCVSEARLVNGSLITENLKLTTSNGSMYICGPTVYSESHLGHALTYMRADIFRKVLKHLFGVHLTTVMNITDIDDKILLKASNNFPDKDVSENPNEHPFNLISDKYYKSFVSDMNDIRVLPPDFSIKISKQIDLIKNYIYHLEQIGHAYSTSSGNVYFDVSSIPNYEGRVDNRKDYSNELGGDEKRDARDFVLWKAAKPGEPVWFYESKANGRILPGRPGWHIQCSAICGAIFGSKLDFHYGGKDLIFPHHYNEQACSCAFHHLDTSKNFHVWSENWLHSGHLVLKDEKMSKSVGNVVGIKDFISTNSVNVLRLLCIESHYRSDVILDNELLQDIKSLDHKISAFFCYLRDEIRRISNASLNHINDDHVDFHVLTDLEQTILKVQEDILDGACDDLDLAKGLRSIMDMAKMVYNIGSVGIKPREIIMIWHLLVDWFEMCGLDYSSTSRSFDDSLVDLVKEFRDDIRNLVIKEIKANRTKKANDDAFLGELLKKCDTIRKRMDELGFVIRDRKS